jgi:hypothetical protein
MKKVKKAKQLADDTRYGAEVKPVTSKYTLSLRCSCGYDGVIETVDMPDGMNAISLYISEDNDISIICPNCKTEIHLNLARVKEASEDGSPVLVGEPVVEEVTEIIKPEADNVPEEIRNEG